MKRLKSLMAALALVTFNIHLFDTPDYNVQTSTLNTEGNSTVDEVKTYYTKNLINRVEPLLVHDQFAQKENIPQGGGDKIEFRRFASLPKALKPLVEGVTPKGNKLNITKLTAQVHQYGDYITTSDFFELIAIDKIVIQKIKILSSQAGRTLDTVTREVLAGGTNVLYADSVNGSTVSTTSARHLLTDNCKLTPDMTYQAKANLSAYNAPKINGRYIAIVHPYAAYDIMRSEEWIEIKTHDPEDYYHGEIGVVGEVKFVETTEAKIFWGEDLCAATRTLTSTNAEGTVTLSNSNKTATVLVSDTLVADELIGRYVISNSKLFKVTDNTTGAIEVVDPDGGTITASDLKNKTIYPGEGGAGGLAVFSTLVLGENAYGVTEITGGGLKTIIKPLGSAGSADPLDQRATVGWKATKAAERLVEEYMIRIESISKYSSKVKAN